MDLPEASAVLAEHVLDSMDSVTPERRVKLLEAVSVTHPGLVGEAAAHAAWTLRRALVAQAEFQALVAEAEAQN